MTQARGPLPSELRAAAKEEARVAKEWRKRRGEPEPMARAAPPAPFDHRSELVDAISREIDDREAFLKNARTMGVNRETTRRVEFEIATRKGELERAAAKLGK